MGQGLPFFIPPLTFTIDALTLVAGKLGRRKPSLHSLDDTVSVVISSHRNEDTIEQCIAPCYEQTHLPINVYVCDTNLDGTKAKVNKLKSQCPNLYYWSKDGIRGKAAKINALVHDPGIKLGKYVYLKDASTSLNPDVIQRLVAGFNGDNVAAVTSYGYVTPPDSHLAGLFHYGKEWTNRLGKWRKSAQQYRRAMFVVCGASFMVRSDVLRENPIPTGTLTEDTAYTWMLQHRGYKIGMAQDAIVNAEDVSTLDAQMRQSFRWFKGSWQNILLNWRKLCNPSSKARNLGYTTILPGVIESSLYAGTLLCLPVVAQFNENIYWGFVIGDTALTFVAPLASTILAGEPLRAPAELYNTIRHFPSITTYKIASSLLWVVSGASTIFDIATRKSKRWTGEWDTLPEGSAYKLKRLTVDCLGKNLTRFMAMEPAWEEAGECPWTMEDLFVARPKQERLSSYAANGQNIIGYTIVSESEPKKAVLHRMLVDSKYQNRGVGSNLIGDMLDRCRKAGINEVYFWVDPDNEPFFSIARKYRAITYGIRDKDGIPKQFGVLRV